MSLLQISEPGQTKKAEVCKGRAVGIDLGTTNSLVAHVQDGDPRVLAADEGQALLPSVVHYAKDGEVVVGRAAARQATRLPRDTIASVKRFMGRGPEDSREIRSLTPYRFASEEGPVVRLAVADGTRQVTPVEVSAEILKALRRVAEEQLDGELDGVVITVPAYFDDAQRQATKDAGRLAGLEVLRLLAEPTAAALAYGLHQQREGTFAVFDLGGGTFDISILKLTEGVFEVQATGGNSALGGDDFDRAVATWLFEQMGVATGGPESAATGDLAAAEDRTGSPEASAAADRSTERAAAGGRTDELVETGTAADRSAARAAASGPSDELVREVLTQARAARERLSDEESTVVQVVRPDDGSMAVPVGGPAGDPFEVTLTREQLDALLQPIVARTGPPCRRALRDAGLQAEELSGVILVGGATRTPAVRRFVADLFGMAPLTDLDPDQVVALGAAVQADLLAGDSPREDVLLLDVIPLSLGLETMGGVVEKLIPRNSTIPCGAKQTFTTFADKQTAFDLHVVQGEREMVSECRSLARFKLGGIPPMPAGMARVEINFLVDADGILRVSAHEEVSGQEASIEVKPTYGLTDDEIERMLMDSFEHAEEDVATRLLVTERVEADRILLGTRQALQDDGELLEAGEREQIEAGMAALLEARAGTDHERIREAIAALDQASREFAGRRMNRTLQSAVAGKAVDDIEGKL